jgi:phosphoribosylanthranilate isomerase
MVDVKICGVCSAADAEAAGLAGAGYVGVILAPGFSRTVSLDAAAVILAAAGTRRAGVFVDASPADVLRAADRLALDVVQLHGDESPETVAEVVAGGGTRVWKAVRVREAADVKDAVARFGSLVDGLLLDGWSAAAHGGVGARFDWAAGAAARSGLPAGVDLIVAGGLRPDNVAAAVALLRPRVVDVSSGVESSPGRKSIRLVHEFMEGARSAAKAEES